MRDWNDDGRIDSIDACIRDDMYDDNYTRNSDYSCYDDESETPGLNDKELIDLCWKHPELAKSMTEFYKKRAEERKEKIRQEELARIEKAEEDKHKEIRKYITDGPLVYKIFIQLCISAICFVIAFLIGTVASIVIIGIITMGDCPLIVFLISGCVLGGITSIWFFISNFKTNEKMIKAEKEYLSKKLNVDVKAITIKGTGYEIKKDYLL